MRKSLAIALSALFIFAACAAQAEGVTLAYKFRAGEIDKYKLVMKMNFDIAGLGRVGMPAGPMAMDFSMVMRQKTLGVYPDGSAKVMFSCGEPNIKMSGVPAIAKSKQPWRSPSMTVVLAPDGGLLKVEGLEKAFAFAGAKGIDLSALQINKFMGFLGQNPVFPSEPLEVGQTWETSVPLPFGNTQIKLLSTLVTDNAAVGRSRAAKVEQSFDGNLDFSEILKSISGMMPANVPGRDMVSQVTGGMEMFGLMTYYFSPSAGKMLKGTGEMVANMSVKLPQRLIQMGGPPQVDMSANITYELMRL